MALLSEKKLKDLSQKRRHITHFFNRLSYREYNLWWCRLSSLSHFRINCPFAFFIPFCLIIERLLLLWFGMNSPENLWLRFTIELHDRSDEHDLKCICKFARGFFLFSEHFTLRNHRTYKLTQANQPLTNIDSTFITLIKDAGHLGSFLCKSSHDQQQLFVAEERRAYHYLLVKSQVSVIKYFIPRRVNDDNLMVSM